MEARREKAAAERQAAWQAQEDALRAANKRRSDQAQAQATAKAHAEAAAAEEARKRRAGDVVQFTDFKPPTTA